MSFLILLLLTLAACCAFRSIRSAAVRAACVVRSAIAGNRVALPEETQERTTMPAHARAPLGKGRRARGREVARTTPGGGAVKSKVLRRAAAGVSQKRVPSKAKSYAKWRRRREALAALCAQHFQYVTKPRV